MGKSSFTQMGENLLNQGGQGNSVGQGGNAFRLFYPAIVRSVEDAAGFNRIKAEIVEMDDSGNIVPGKDKDKPLEQLPICIPVGTEFLHARPQVGEQVQIICENPTDLASPRFWFGPVITAPDKLSYQSFQDSIGIYDRNSFLKKEIFHAPTNTKNAKVGTLFPLQNEIALQGRQDADVILRPREVYLTAGKFRKGTLEPNTAHPCRIQIRQIDAPTNLTGVKIIDDLTLRNFQSFSQINVEGTNINLISTEGKNRFFDANHEENTTNKRLKDYGEIASKLHPLVFGDELIVLLRLMLRFMVTHIHTPQKPALPNQLTPQLMEYLNGGKLQTIISNNVRTN